MKIIILAGGAGARLWPLSRQNNPKQVQPFIDEETLLQKTYQRLLKGFKVENIYVATIKEYVKIVKEQLPRLSPENILIEPEKKNTAAAIGLIATRFYWRNPQEIICTVHSDHYIDDEDEYIKILKLAEKTIFKKPEFGALIGCKPAYPETGFGYIKMNERFIVIDGHKVFKVDKFAEKPDLAAAKKYLSAGEYLWNPGYFVWRVDALLAHYRRQLPRMYQIFAKINLALGKTYEQEVLDNEFNKIEPVAVEYGIYEKIKNLAVIPADFVFTDVGSWRAVKNLLQSKENENIIKGTVIEVDSSNNLIYNFTKQAVTIAGLHDMIVIATVDATLVCHQDNAQDVKKIVDKLKERGMDNFL